MEMDLFTEGRRERRGRKRGTPPSSPSPSLVMLCSSDLLIQPEATLISRSVRILVASDWR